MEKGQNRLIAVLFCGFLWLAFLANLIAPDRAFSSMENRALAQLPAFNAGELRTGRLFSRLDAYLGDQFVGRERWIFLKAGCEALMGRGENGGVYFAAQDTLISGTPPADEKRVAQNLSFVEEFAARMERPVYFCLVPGKAWVWSERLAGGAPVLDEGAVIDLGRALETRWVEMADALWQQRDRALYYRTDHHWTSLGAWQGYRALGEAMGFSPVPLEDYTRTVVVHSDFYGTDYSAAGAWWIRPDEMDIYVPEEGISVTSWQSGEAAEGVLYDWGRLEEKDKYAFFLGGNQSLCVVKTGQTDAPKLLIVRDSYADCLVPFLTAHFSEIHLMDPRYNKTSVSTYANDIGADAVLVLYSVSNFVGDTNLFVLSR